MTRRIWLLSVVIGAMVLFAQPAGAVEVDGIYEAQVPVNTQSASDRTAAIRLALGEVLVKASGRTDATSIPAINDVLNNATRYVQQYRYRSASSTSGSGTNSSKSLVLWVRFDPAAIDRLLRNHGLPVWGRARPVALLWLAIESHGRRELVGADSHQSAQQLVLSEADRRGLPLHLPLLDLADQSNISTSDVWGGFQDTIMKASQRYQTDSVLVARVYQAPDNQWHARWTLYEQNTSDTWENTGGALAEVIDPGIDRTADILSQQFAQVSSGNEKRSVLIRIDDIKTLAQYSHTIDYLSSLSAVTAVEPSELDTDSAIFRLTIRGDSLGLVQTISLGHTLASEPTPPEAAPDDSTVGTPATLVPELVYRLLP